MPGRVLTVILNYRTAEMTLRATRAALRAMDGVAGEVIVVDNASGDGSEARLRAALEGTPGVRVIQAGHNGGFGAGNNVGIRAGLAATPRPDHVYLLNSDAFPEPGTIAALRDHLDAHPRAGMVGSHVYGTDGATHVTAFRFPSARSEFETAACTGPISRLLRRHIVAPPPPKSTTAVDWLSGCSLMLRARMLDRIGLFDEGFFLYFEETDLCRRAAADGWERVYLPQVGVEHVGSLSTGMGAWARTPGYWFDSRWRYFAKHHGRAGAVLSTLAHLAGGVLWRLRCAIQRRTDVGTPHFLRDLVRHMLTGAPRPDPHRRDSAPRQTSSG